jgi:hypothetical protein
MSDESPAPEARHGSRSDPQLEEAIEQIRQSLHGLRFGQVTIIVQDGVVIQVERTERKRLRRGER